MYPFCIGNITNAIATLTDLFGQNDSYLCTLLIIFNRKGHLLFVLLLQIPETLKVFQDFRVKSVTNQQLWETVSWLVVVSYGGIWITVTSNQNASVIMKQIHSFES